MSRAREDVNPLVTPVYIRSATHAPSSITSILFVGRQSAGLAGPMVAIGIGRLVLR